MGCVARVASMLAAPPHATIPMRCRSSRPAPRVCRAERARGGPSSSEEDADGAAPRHWSRKLRGAGSDVTRDDLRYMSAKVAPSGNDAGGLGATLIGVKRDRDNVTLVEDERLVVPFLAEALGVTQPEAEDALAQLCAILPPVRRRGAIRKMGAPTIARLCRDLPGLSRRLLELKRVFPACDVAEMAVVSSHLLTESMEDVIEPSLAALRETFPEAGVDGKPGVDRMVFAVPQLLDADFAEKAVAAVSSSFGVDLEAATRAVHKDPRLALRVESGAVRSRYSASFDQANVVANRVVKERAREDYYRPGRAREP